MHGTLKVKFRRHKSSVTSGGDAGPLVPDV